MDSFYIQIRASALLLYMDLSCFAHTLKTQQKFHVGFNPRPIPVVRGMEGDDIEMHEVAKVGTFIVS